MQDNVGADNKHKIFVIDDEEAVLIYLSRVIKKEGFDVITARSGEEALKLAKSFEFDLAICDYRMPGLDGIQTVTLLKETHPLVGTIIISGYGSIETVIDAFTKGRVDYYLKKPFNLVELRQTIGMAIKAFDFRKRESLYRSELKKSVSEAVGELMEKNQELQEKERDLIKLNQELESDQHRLKKANELLKILSITDGQTNLFNHRYFMRRLNDELDRATRYGGSLALVMGDIDNFKAVNDTYGHQAGDETLKVVADVFRTMARSIDVVARYGGEEFAVILPESEVLGASTFAERLRLAVEAANIKHDGDRFNVTISFGVATFSKGDTSKTLIHDVDEALYFAKANGKNCVCVNGREGMTLYGSQELDVTETQPNDWISRLKHETYDVTLGTITYAKQNMGNPIFDHETLFYEASKNLSSVVGISGVVSLAVDKEGFVEIDGADGETLPPFNKLFGYDPVDIDLDKEPPDLDPLDDGSNIPDEGMDVLEPFGVISPFVLTPITGGDKLRYFAIGLEIWEEPVEEAIRLFARELYLLARQLSNR